MPLTSKLTHLVKPFLTGPLVAALFAMTTSTPLTATGSSIQSRTPVTQQIQFADEIMRRLRRVGLNFDRERIARPYDPQGELC